MFVRVRGENSRGSCIDGVGGVEPPDSVKRWAELKPTNPPSPACYFNLKKNIKVTLYFLPLVSL